MENSCTVDETRKEHRCKCWTTCSSIRSFARTAHSFTCSGQLASLAPSAALTRSLPRSLRSLPRWWESGFLMSQNDLVLSHSVTVQNQARPLTRPYPNQAKIFHHWHWHQRDHQIILPHSSLNNPAKISTLLLWFILFLEENRNWIMNFWVKKNDISGVNQIPTRSLSE